MSIDIRVKIPSTERTPRAQYTTNVISSGIDPNDTCFNSLRAIPSILWTYQGRIITATDTWSSINYESNDEISLSIAEMAS